MNTITEILFALIAYEVLGFELSFDIKDKITVDILPDLYKLSKKHDMAHLISDAIYKNGFDFSGNEYYNKFQKEQITAIYRYQQQNFELQRVCALFEENQIPFIPLKGAVIRDYYPEPWMRTSCDIDILVKSEDLEKAKELLIGKLGYDYDTMIEHDMEFFSPSGMHFELHFRLSKDEEITNAEIWETAYLKENTKYQYLMPKEYFVSYHLLHMSKHIINGGCGIKPFVDLSILQDRFGFDKEKLTTLCKKLGIKIFFEKMILLMKVWFENAEYSAQLYELENYILTGGVYGNSENKIAVKKSKKGGQIGFLLPRIFPPKEYLEKLFGKTKIKTWHYPYYAFRRMLRILDKEKYRKASKEASISKTEFLDYIGLK